MTRLAIITGAGSGIGRELARQLAEAGIHVLGAGRRPAPLEETRRSHPDRIDVVRADIATAAGREAVINALPVDGELKYLVHNAGLLTPIEKLANVDEDEWRYHMAVNVEAPLFLTQALLPRLMEGSRILHISTGAAHSPYAGWGAYCTSKAALFMLYRVWKEELQGTGILIGSAQPGVVDTHMQHQIRSTSEDKFPQKQRFVTMKEQDELLSPAESASFLKKLLIETADEEFGRKDWDARE